MRREILLSLKCKLYNTYIMVDATHEGKSVKSKQSLEKEIKYVKTPMEKIQLQGKL